MANNYTKHKAPMVKKMLKEGKEFAQIATDLGVSRNYVLKTAGHKPVPRHTQAPAIRVALAAGDRTVKEIACEFGVSERHVRRCRAAGDPHRHSERAEARILEILTAGGEPDPTAIAAELGCSKRTVQNLLPTRTEPSPAQIAYLEQLIRELGTPIDTNGIYERIHRLSPRQIALLIFDLKAVRDFLKTTRTKQFKILASPILSKIMTKLPACLK